MKKILLAAVVITAALSACVNPPEYPIEPAITFSNVSRTQLLAGDSVQFTVNFTDGDGDIGAVPGSISTDTTTDYCDIPTTATYFNDAFWTVFLMDSRDSCWIRFQSPFVEAEGSFDDLSGQLTVITALDSKLCFGQPLPCTEQTQYTIFVRDRAGHFSNAVVSPVIEVLSQ